MLKTFLAPKKEELHVDDHKKNFSRIFQFLSVIFDLSIRTL